MALKYMGKLRRMEAHVIIEEIRRATPALKAGFSGCMMHLYRSTAENARIFNNALFELE